MVVGRPIRTYFRRFVADNGAGAGDRISHAISVRTRSLAQLPASASASGFHFAANIFGSVINTGSLQFYLRQCPRMQMQKASIGRRVSASWHGDGGGLITIFVAFAIGQTFTDKANSWISLGIGVVTTILFALVALPLLTKNFSVASVSRGRLSKTGDYAANYCSRYGANGGYNF